ncbi:hypothetical protein ACHAXR_004966 [Thalassiosira sp. AJA248-18]
MNHAAAKKRKIDDQQDGAPSIAEEVGTAVAVAAPDPMMAEMRAMLEKNNSQMAQMQEEMDRRLSLIDGLENKCRIMQNRLTQIDGLEVKCQLLEARCGSLERTLQSLTKNKNWKYYAPPVPTSYWAELGFDEEYIELMESFLGDVNDDACKLRSGEEFCEKRISLNGRTEDGIILHDDILLPHWREYADALQLYSQNEPYGFALSSIQLPSAVLNMLSPAFQGERFNGLGLCNNDFPNIMDGIDFAIKFIQQNPNLINFFWMKNPINSTENVHRLVEAVNSLPSLENISLEGCCGDPVNGYSILCSLLTHHQNCKVIIDLDLNNIRTLGGTHLPDFLATNPPLQELYLEHNHLNDNDATLIAEALKLNRNLTILRVGGNEITDTGCSALRKAIFDSVSLNSVADSNHKCCIKGLGFGGVVKNCFDESKENRGAKIYALLCSRNSEGANVCHLDLEFGDDALKLTPKILECVYHYSEYYCNFMFGDTKLSVIYEILRRWRIPELYESYINRDK